MIHGTERDVEKRLTRLRSDQIANGQQLYDLEQQLKGVLARLAQVEQALAQRGYTLEDNL